jgi:hypothetical protein|tara:strand:- start:173 stop:367 length:195 start_codon:yes stop_codon:yes gene_type:complete
MTNSNERFFTVDEQGTWWRVNEDARWRGPCADIATADLARENSLINQIDGAADFASDNHAFSGR